MVYDGTDVVADIVDEDGDGIADRRRLYWILPKIDQRVGFVDIVGNTATAYYYITDQVGSVLQVLDSSGTVVNQYNYDAWGNLLPSGSFETVPNRYRFQGREWDENLQAYYFRYRMYFPETGTFSGPDMKIRVDRFGARSYVAFGGDSNRNRDPDGADFLTEEEIRIAGHVRVQVWYTPEGAFGVNMPRHYVGHVSPNDPNEVVFSGANNIVIDYVKLKGKADEWFSGVKTFQDIEHLVGLRSDVSDRVKEQPGFLVSIVPFYGSGKNILHSGKHGDVGGMLYHSGMFALDVFLVRAVVMGALTKTGLKATTAGGTSLTHFTSAAGSGGIAETGLIGGKYGIFAIESSRAPASNLGRWLVSAGGGTKPISIPASAAPYFSAPRIAGPFTAGFRAMGWMKTPLGALSTKTGGFIPNLIYKGKAFRCANWVEKGVERGHTFFLFYFFDAGTNVILKHAPAAAEDWKRDGWGPWRFETTRSGYLLGQ